MNSWQKLINWYVKTHRDFPWRKNPNLYWVWIAEVMSQQTQMASVLPYFEKFIQKFSTLQRLSMANEDEVLKMWAGLGYYSRAKNLFRSAQIICETYGGQFPQALVQWLALPGVGPYTAAAIVSQCFNHKVPVWDGNVLRVCSRLFANKNPYTKEFKKHCLIHLSQALKNFQASHFNQGLMELGALICTPRNPQCKICPLQKSCKAFVLKQTHLFPPPKLRNKTVLLKPNARVEIFKGQNGHEIFLKCRPSGLWFSGLWDFPSELGSAKKPIYTRLSPFKKYHALEDVSHTITHHKILLKGRYGFTVTKKFKNTPKQGWFLISDLKASNPPVALATTAKKLLKILPFN